LECGRRIFLPKSDVGVIIPALNEPYLPNLLAKLTDYSVHVETEHGLSYAVRHGILMSDEDILVIMDGDGSHDPIYIERMLKLLNSDTTLVVGSRYVDGGYSHDSFVRKVMSLVYCLIARVILRTSIKDAMSGFWVGYRSALKFTPTKGYKFGLQLIRKNKEHIVEFPIVFLKRKEGKSKIKPVQALKDLLSIFK
jgi:dolichol-phosphate mannosyltransferase